MSLASMDHGRSLPKLTSAFVNLQLNSSSRSSDCCRTRNPYGHDGGIFKPRSLIAHCLGVLGQNLEEIIDDLVEIAALFPPNIKMAIMAMTRRRKMLCDKVLIAFADSIWSILDVSDSEVSDFGMESIVSVCKNLQAIDISKCERITQLGVAKFLKQCPSLVMLKWGGCQRSDLLARSCLSMLKPKLNIFAEDCWEDLDADSMLDGSDSLCWLVWMSIDNHSKELLENECPRIVVNSRPSTVLHQLQVIPEAFPDVALDSALLWDIDQGMLPVTKVASSPRSSINHNSNELPKAERFRLAYVERDERLAPKRAKNLRQHKRRAERDWVMSNSDAKSIVLATRVSKALRGRS